MNKFVIITDSCSDMSKKFREENNVDFLPLTYIIEGKEYIDDLGVYMPYKDFYNLIREGKTGSTSQITPQLFYEKFKSYAENGLGIIYIGLSGGLSGTYGSSCIAKKMILDDFPNSKIEVIDSRTGSLGLSMLIQEALNEQSKGKDFDEVVAHVQNKVKELKSYVTVDDLDHLKRGGRISSLKSTVGTLLNVKPIIVIDEEGKLDMFDKARGKKATMSKLSDFAKEYLSGSENPTIGICHMDCYEDAKKFSDILKDRIGIKNVLIEEIGPIIGIHLGIGAMAVFLMK